MPNPKEEMDESEGMAFMNKLQALVGTLTDTESNDLRSKIETYDMVSVIEQLPSLHSDIYDMYCPDGVGLEVNQRCLFLKIKIGLRKYEAFLCSQNNLVLRVDRILGEATELEAMTYDKFWEWLDSLVMIKKWANNISL